jgi:hypothetical protein
MSEDAVDAELDARSEALKAEYEAGVRDFSDREITGVRIGNAELKSFRFSGTQFVDCVFFKTVFDDSDFTRARFMRCNVSGCGFQRAKLDHAVLGPARFFRADFFEASLLHANFQNCDASHSYFGLANLSDANLNGGRFEGAWFMMTMLGGAILVGGDFEGALVKSFNLIGHDTLAKNAALLRQTLGVKRELEQAIARATPQSRALAASFARDKLGPGEEPPSFEEMQAFLDRLEKQYEHLRRFLLASGCDAQEVAAMSEAADKLRPEYPRVFISYSSADEAFAHKLYDALASFGVDTWFAPENMRGGRKINEQLEQAIDRSDKIVLLLSENSLKSPWVAHEIQWAVAREVESGEQVLFPIRIVPFEMVCQWTLFDADLGRDVAKVVRQYFIPDFSAWQDAESLARCTERFLRDLRQASLSPASSLGSRH